MRSESSSRYLTFALKIRKLTDALIIVVEKGEAPPGLADSLKQALGSLQDAGQRTSVKALRSRGAFGHYENVVTMNEVARVSNKDDIISNLNRVINARTKQQKQNSALDAIHFFDALERRALYHHSHPALSRESFVQK